MKAIYAAALLCLCFGGPAVMSPAEQVSNEHAERQARVREINQRHMPFVLRIANKFPAAEFGQPVQHLEKK